MARTMSQRIKSPTNLYGLGVTRVQTRENYDWHHSSDLRTITSYIQYYFFICREIVKIVGVMSFCGNVVANMVYIEEHVIIALHLAFIVRYVDLLGQC
jgi:hypothetical protein